MSAVHGLGPSLALLGGLVAMGSLGIGLRMGSPAATDDTGSWPRLAQFNRRVSRAMKPLFVFGVAVGVVGLIIWAFQ